MRKIYYVLLLVALITISCDDKKKDLSAKFDTLMTETDSIEASHQNFEKTHADLMAEHRQFKEKLKTMTIKDSSALEDMARHEVMLKRHDAIIESHGKLIKGHKELKEDFDSMSDVKMEAQIEAMKKDHEKMMNEHSTMEKEHQTMVEEHKDIQSKLKESTNEEDNM